MSLSKQCVCVGVLTCVALAIQNLAQVWQDAVLAAQLEGNCGKDIKRKTRASTNSGCWISGVSSMQEERQRAITVERKMG